MPYSSWPGYVDCRAGVGLNAWGGVRRLNPLHVPFGDPALIFGGRRPELGPVKRVTCTRPADDATFRARRLFPSRIHGTQVDSYYFQGVSY